MSRSSAFRIAQLATTVLALALIAAAQTTGAQPGPQGTINNQNSPQMQTAPTQPASAPPATATKSGTSTATAATPTTPEPAAAVSTKTPHTEIVETPSTGPLSADPLLQPPPMPTNKSTLIGGLARKVDRIRNRVVIAPYGSNKTITVQFDERSHIYRDGHETTILGVHKNDRLYADTMLVGPTVFARNLRVVTSMQPAEAAGQVVAYDPRGQLVRMTDKLTGALVIFHITPETELTSKNGNGVSDLRPGSIVSVSFAPGRKGGDARQLSILAVPGTRYLFAGRITNLDLHLGILDVENQSDGKNYELHFNTAAMENRNQLRVGAQIASNAVFDGRTYTAQQVTVMPEQSQSAQQ